MSRIRVIAGLGLALANGLLIKCGLRKRRDGWRRAAGLVLRGDGATFVLSAFGLNVWSDVKERPVMPTMEQTGAHAAERIARQMAAEAGMHVRIARGELEDRVEPCAGPSYTLGFEDWVDGPARFVRPGTWGGRDFTNEPRAQTSVLVNLICRVDGAGRADVWACFNHIGIDGVPAQEFMSRLEKSWGAAETVVFPTPQEFAPHAGPRPCLGRPELGEVQAFLDFAPLLAWRKAMNAKLPEPMTLAAAMIWAICRMPGTEGIRVGTTVEVPAVGGLGRGVSLIAVRPQDYFSQSDGLARYVRYYNRQLELIRTRSSGACMALDAMALVGPRTAAAVLRNELGKPHAFGSLGLTVLKDAKVFGAPMGDVGHKHGFIAVGGVALPAKSGRQVGCVAIKGDPKLIVSYPALLQAAMKQVSA